MSFLWRKDMTREDAKKLLPIIVAYANGETIQIKYSTVYQDCNSPSFDISLDYRIKPKPREFWVNDCKDGSVRVLYACRANAEKYLCAGGKTTHLIEVLEDE